MKKKAIELTLEQAQKLYKESNDDIKNLLLTTFSKEELEEDKYPNTWEKCIDKFKKLYYISRSTCLVSYITLAGITNYTGLKYCVPSEKIAKQIRALEQLLVCRDAWRNGWVSSNNDTTDRGAIYRKGNNLEVVNTVFNNCILQFPTKEIAEKFLNTFRNLIEEAGDLI